MLNSFLLVITGYKINGGKREQVKKRKEIFIFSGVLQRCR